MSEMETVCIVDDDASVRKALGRLLRAHGYSVEEFGSATAYLETARAHDGCLILDVQMPGLDGLSLQEEILARDMNPSIIFITAHGDVPKSVRAMKRGAIDFLQKPFEESDLLRALSAAIATDRERRGQRAERGAIKDRVERLTPREREVFERVILGRLNKEIASELGVSEKTVKAHRARVMRKMEADSLAHLVRMAQRVDM